MRFVFNLSFGMANFVTAEMTKTVHVLFQFKNTIIMLKFFKIIALLEGISLLVLFFFAMPMKRIFGQPEYIFPVGMAHGLLFIAYIIMAIMLKFEEDWSAKKLAIISAASIIPFGTFYIERKYLR